MPERWLVPSRLMVLVKVGRVVDDLVVQPLAIAGERRVEPSPRDSAAKLRTRASFPA